MKTFKVGLQLYSVRDFMEKDFEGTVQKVAAMGYDGVEFAGAFDKTAEEIVEICKKAGVVPVSAHVPFPQMLEDPEKTAKFWGTVGLKTIVIPWLDDQYRPGRPGYETFKEVVRKMAEESKKYGMILCYHNHDFEFEKLNDRYLLDIMYEDSPKELLQSQIDTCWARVGMGDPVGYLSQFVDRAPTVHLKDYVGEKSNNMYKLIGKNDTNNMAEEKNTFEFRPVGSGCQDFKAILAESEKIGAEWIIVEQDRPAFDKTSLENVQMSYDYVKSINGNY